MKQDLSNSIRENANLRQLLLKQDGGIMKFWAEHPDKDFDVDLFDDYENQIVKDYLQANKQNRAVRSLAKDILKNKSLDWYHQSKGSEFKFIVALKPELNTIDSELYEQFLKEVDIYMVDAYKESRRRKYPDGISPLDFYNEVIEKYGLFGLAIECLDRVLQEYRGNTVDLTDKRSILTLLRQLDGSAPTSPELEEENNLQTEFDIRMFIVNFFANGGYKKLRQAIKEIIDKGTINHTEDKCRERCCKIVEDNMMKVNQFTRWVNNESYPMKEDKEGKLAPLITSEERLWLQNIMYENSPGETGTKKLTDIDCHFCHFLSILQGIGKLWAAQLLVRGIDMKELEKKTGVIMNRHSGFLYYVDRFVDDQRGDCCIYDWPEAENLLAKVKPIKKVEAEEPNQDEVSDFKHLKDWKENTDLDYYLSEEHWNYHVNTLLYNNILVFHEKELGAFLNPTYDSISHPIRDYTQQYGEMFNEAYRLCNIVLSSPVPATKVAQLAADAAKVGIKRMFGNSVDQYGNPVSIDKLIPNVTDLIESYHILGMVNAIITFSDVQNDAVNKFLIALSVYNDNGMYFCGYTHSFGTYNEIYEALILSNIVNGTMLRPGYDNISRDKYLRKNVPWYEHLASKLEKEKQKDKDKKTASIQEQNNNDSIVINGPVKDCTFIMPAATPTSKQKPKVAKPKTKTEKKPSGKPMTLKYYTHGNNGMLMRQRKRVHQVFKMWNRWGWIDEQTAIEDFDAFFEGVPKHCNITWTGSNTTILTIVLQELLKQSYFDKQTGCAARSLVEQQFGKTANFDRTRLDNDMEEKINLTLFVLAPQNHDLIFQSSDNLSEVEDIQDAALIEIFSGKLRSTKGI